MSTSERRYFYFRKLILILTFSSFSWCMAVATPSPSSICKETKVQSGETRSSHKYRNINIHETNTHTMYMQACSIKSEKRSQSAKQQILQLNKRQHAKNSYVYIDTPRCKGPKLVDPVTFPVSTVFHLDVSSSGSPGSISRICILKSLRE